MRGRSIHELLRDYQDARQWERELPKELAARLAEYERFVRSRGHVLQRDPAQLFAQGAAQARDSAVGEDCRRLFQDGHGPAHPWFRLRNVRETDPQGHSMRIDVGTAVNAVAWLKFRDQPHALAGCEDGSLRVYDLATRRLVEPIMWAHTGAVRAVVVTPDGHHALSGGIDQTLRWWDLEVGRCLRTLDGHTGAVGPLALSGDGRNALSGSEDGTLRWWDLESGYCLRILEGHTNLRTEKEATIWVRAVALSADGGHALSGANDGTLRWWDLVSGRCLHSDEGNIDNVLAVTFSEEGYHVLSESSADSLHWWPMENGGCIDMVRGTLSP